MYSIDTVGRILIQVESEAGRYFLYRSADYLFLVKEGEEGKFEKVTLDQSQKSEAGDQVSTNLLLLHLGKNTCPERCLKLH